MIGEPGGAGYDRAITIFSPDGRLFQVEYAIEAVKRGTTALCVKHPEGVIFAVEKRKIPLQEELESEKIFKIDHHIGMAISGLTADARILVDQARVTAQVNILSYNTPISVLECTRDLCDTMQSYTQNAGVRPFGISLLIGGVDPDGTPRLYMTDPSGAYWSYKCVVIGRGSTQVREFMEANYESVGSFQGAENFTVDCLRQVIDDIDVEKFEIAVIKVEDRKFRFYTDEEKQAILDRTAPSE